MIKPPSLVKEYTAFYSKDAAVLPLPSGATKEQIAERDRLIQLARDTGDLSHVQPPGGEAVTAFRLRPLSADQYGHLASMNERGDTHVQIATLAFRMALVDVAPLPGDVRPKFMEHPQFGTIALTGFFDELKLPAKMSADIVVELGELAIERARDLSPKS